MRTGTATHRAPLPLNVPAGRRVLVVEDDAHDREYLSAVLRAHGFEVCACGTASDGARCLRERHYDFIVVSQGSRAFEGRAVLEHAVEVDRAVPVVVLTRCVDMHCYLEAMQLGAIDYLEKPISESEIVRLVVTHLRPATPTA